MFLSTGIEYVPIELSTGPCFKNYSHPSAYIPRQHALQQVSLNLKNGEAILCYSESDNAKKRVFGSQVKYGELWSMGNYEPTRLYTNTDILFGDLSVPAGRYAIYAIPDTFNWTIFLSNSINHWGNEISAEVRRTEIGKIRIKPEYLIQSVEYIHYHFADDELIMDWGQTRVRIPIKAD